MWTATFQSHSVTSMNFPNQTNFSIQTLHSKSRWFATLFIINCWQKHSDLIRCLCATAFLDNKTRRSVSQLFEHHHTPDQLCSRSSEPRFGLLYILMSAEVNKCLPSLWTLIARQAIHQPSALPVCVRERAYSCLYALPWIRPAKLSSANKSMC